MMTQTDFFVSESNLSKFEVIADKIDEVKSIDKKCSM